MQQQIYAPPLTRINKFLLIACGGVFLIYNILQFWGWSGHFESILSLTSNRFLSGHLYQLLTYPFLIRGIFEFLFDAMILWFLGSELERSWGPKTYIQFLLSSSIFGGIFFLIVHLVFAPGYLGGLRGLTGLTSSLLMSYSIIYPERHFSFMFLFPVKAKYFCWLVVVVLFFSGIFSRDLGAFGHLGAMAGGFLFMWLKSKKPSLSSKKAKMHLTLIKKDLNKDDDNKKGPRYYH